MFVLLIVSRCFSTNSACNNALQEGPVVVIELLGANAANVWKEVSGNLGMNLQCVISIFFG